MNNDEYQALLKDTELRLDKLKSLYEQWFQGLERLEPRQARDEIDRRIAAFRKQPTRNTALRFRTQTLIQRYVTLQTHWNRVAREIEEGRHVRDIRRARRRAKQHDQALARATPDAAENAAYELDLDVDVDLTELGAGSLFEDDDLDGALARLDAPKSVAAPPPSPTPKPSPVASARPAPPPPPASPKPPPVASARPAPSPAPSPSPPAASSAATRFAKPKAEVPPPTVKRATPPVASPKPATPPARPAAPGPTDERIRDLFDRYVDARKRNNERVDNVRFETLAASIRKMVPELEQKHRGKRIDFEVVVKDGRVGLKPVPKD